MDIGRVRTRVGDRVALQGNLDPSVLYADKKIIAEKALSVMQSYGEGTGHIFNLGHGILPDVPPENAKFLVDFIKEASYDLHR
jgi:uroporphyrinogen decarboxylase